MKDQWDKICKVVFGKKQRGKQEFFASSPAMNSSDVFCYDCLVGGSLSDAAANTRKVVVQCKLE